MSIYHTQGEAKRSVVRYGTVRLSPIPSERFSSYGGAFFLCPAVDHGLFFFQSRLLRLFQLLFRHCLVPVGLVGGIADYRPTKNTWKNMKEKKKNIIK